MKGCMHGMTQVPPFSNEQWRSPSHSTQQEAPLHIVGIKFEAAHHQHFLKGGRLKDLAHHVIHIYLAWKRQDKATLLCGKVRADPPSRSQSVRSYQLLPLPVLELSRLTNITCLFTGCFSLYAIRCECELSSRRHRVPVDEPSNLSD